MLGDGRRGREGSARPRPWWPHWGCWPPAAAGERLGGGKVTIRYSWWGAKDRAELTQKTVKMFEKKHPNIKVKTDFSEYTDFWSKFNTQAADGNAPDVFQNSYAFLRKYGDKNLLLDLNGQAKAGNLSLKGFRNGLEKAGDIDGKLLGVPVGANTFALFCNPDAYRKAGVTVEAGWTWDDFFTATPDADTLVRQAAAVRTPPQLVAGPADIARAKVFGGLFAPSTAPPPPGPGSRTGWTSSSTSTRARSNSAVGTASGTSGTSCTPTTGAGASGGTTSEATPGTTPSSRPVCGCGRRICAPAAPTSSASPNP